MGCLDRRQAKGRLRRTHRALAIPAIMLAVVTGMLAVLLSAGVASAADPLIGKKYSYALKYISARNGTPVVATVSGSQVALEDCVVISWSRGGFLNSRGKNDRRNEFYVHLNCNNTVASPGHPGNSAMTPEGAKNKKLRDWAAYLKDHPERCTRSEESMEECRKFCRDTGLCEFKI